MILRLISRLLAPHDEVPALRAEVARLGAELDARSRAHLRAIDDALRERDAWRAALRNLIYASGPDDPRGAAKVVGDYIGDLILEVGDLILEVVDAREELRAGGIGARRVAIVAAMRELQADRQIAAIGRAHHEALRSRTALIREREWHAERCYGTYCEDPGGETGGRGEGR